MIVEYPLALQSQAARRRLAEEPPARTSYWPIKETMDVPDRRSGVQIVILTAAEELLDRIISLGVGTTELLDNPVDLRELATRVRASLLPDNLPTTAAPEARRWHPFGRTWLDVEAARLETDDGTEIPMTAMEFNLLRLFAHNRGRVLNRDQILEGAHDRPWDPFDRSIDIRISRIRRKIERNPEKPEAIRTVRGVGYIYDPR